MRRRSTWATEVVMILVACSAVCGASEEESREPGQNVRLVRDALWAWGNPEMAEEGAHTHATFAQACPAERARLLGTPNIIMAGHGLPRDDAAAAALTKEVGHAPRLVWEVATDDEGEDAPFVYAKTIARLRGLAGQYPQIEGVLLDDMSTTGINRGFKPEHIGEIRNLLGDLHEQVKVWGVVYTMNLDLKGIAGYMNELDAITLAVWHAKDLANLDANVARVREMAPGKPIMLCLYLYDYGEGRRMPLDILEKQCATALRMLHAGDIDEILFVTIDNDEDAVSWAADWVRKVGGQEVGSPPASPGTAGDLLRIGDGAAWGFPRGDWTQSDDGVIRPPDERNLHSRAFHLDRCYGDFEAEFEFNANYRECGTGTAGFVLRAQNANHFYLVHFPWGGQQLRAKHFWAAIAKVDGDGYVRNIAAEWVPGVPSEVNRWYGVRVVADGPEIQVWVDGHEALRVRDTAYQNGRVGLAGYGWYYFRNVRVHGQASEPAPWDDAAQVPSHAFTVGLSSAEMPSACIAPNGDVLVAAGNQLVRSKDKGRTWEAPETLPEALGVVTDYGSSMYCASQDRVSVMLHTPRRENEGPKSEIAIADSLDNGMTWSDPVQADVADGWPEVPASLTPYGPVTAGKDGTLMRFMLGGASTGSEHFTNVITWSATHCKAYVLRSTDAGKSWSAPIELDRPSWANAERGTIPGSLDFTEPTGVVIGDTVTALIRPIYSPYMWQCWSHDGGATWDAASRATFPGYAQSMARTTSGAILCAHRYPLYSVNVSRDDGLHWDAGTVIDYPAWAMGTMLEVEPDVLLLTYMNAERDQPLLAQLVRVTPTRVEPVPREGK
ncbi:MAG: DUF1080 domain-containing protein [bacterium]|nr:DUF1080 domain-containing protein [bacterium]